MSLQASQLLLRSLLQLHSLLSSALSLPLTTRRKPSFSLSSTGLRLKSTLPKKRRNLNSKKALMQRQSNCTKMLQKFLILLWRTSEYSKKKSHRWKLQFSATSLSVMVKISRISSKSNSVPRSLIDLSTSTMLTCSSRLTSAEVLPMNQSKSISRQ